MSSSEIQHTTIRQRLRHPLPRARVPGLPALPTTTRVLLLVLGWMLILIGVLGLVVPGLQGILTILVGAAALSLVSRTMLNSLRFVMRPWPRAWRTLLRTRRRVHRWILEKQQR